MSIAWQVATVVVGLFGGDKKQEYEVDRGAGFRFLDGLVLPLFTTFLRILVYLVIYDSG